MRIVLRACLLLSLASIAGAQDAAPARPAQPPAREQHSAPGDSTLLDINTASFAQLKALPGFGAAYARRVIAARPYVAKNQLVTRGVLPADAYTRISPLVIARHPRK